MPRSGEFRVSCQETHKKNINDDENKRTIWKQTTVQTVLEISYILCQKGPERQAFICLYERRGNRFLARGRSAFLCTAGKGELQRGAFRGGTTESKAGRRALGESVSHDRQWLLKEIITP